MVPEDQDGKDWRSIATRAPNRKALDTARRRGQEAGRGRTAEAPEQIPARGWTDILWRAALSFSRDRVLATAGGVAFFTLLAVFPGIATIVSVYGLFADPNVITQHTRLLSGILPAGVLDLVVELDRPIAAKGTGTLGTTSTLSLLIAFWSANSGVSALFDALNVIYKENETRTYLRFYGTTILFTLSAVTFALAATGLLVVLPVFLNGLGLGSITDTALRIGRWPALFVVVSLSLSLMYRYGPSRREAKWRWVSWGGSVAALLWVCASAVFAWYVASFDSYNRTYGSLGAVVGFMTWIWLSIVVVLVGAELNSEMERQTATDSTGGEPKPLGRRNAVAADTVGPTRS